MLQTIAIPVSESSAAGHARRTALHMAVSLGLSEATQGRVAVVTNELAGNILKHAGGKGEILLQASAQINAASVPALEVIALDRGPGMADVGACLRDGYSTAGTAGTGLGAVQRQANDFGIHSQSGMGTVVLARLSDHQPGVSGLSDLVKSPAASVATGAISVPVRTERVCGDAWAFLTEGERLFCMVVDGLGHGPGAAEAAELACKTFYERAAARSPIELMNDVHGALRRTRGAAVALVTIDERLGRLRFVGVGNISAAIIDNERSVNLVSMNGIVGHEARSIRDFEHDWPANAVLVMHSDGIGTRWQLKSYAGLTKRDPSLIAAVLLRDFIRQRDDATVFVLSRKVQREAGYV